MPNGLKKPENKPTENSLNREGANGWLICTVAMKKFFKMKAIFYEIAKMGKKFALR